MLPENVQTYYTLLDNIDQKDIITFKSTLAQLINTNLSNINHLMENALCKACHVGVMDIIQYLLSLNISIQCNDGDALSNACSKGHLEIVKYLLTSSDLQQHADIFQNNSKAFISACRNDHVDIIIYLLTSPDLQQHADVNVDNDMPIRFACHHSNLELIKYYLTSPDLKKHSNIYASNNDCTFILCTSYNNHPKGHCNIDILRWLIFDYQIEINNDIREDMMDDYITASILKEKEALDFKNMLDHQIIEKENQINKVKI